LFFVLTATLACGGSQTAGNGGPLIVFTAGSLARPMRAALDSFAARDRVRYELESAGSLETARKLTELGKIPDVIALADEDVFPKLLVPTHVSWYVRFAENRIVLAYTDRSRFAAEIDSTNWWQVLQRSGLEIGRANPDLDPAGYRTLMVFQLAEKAYGAAGLAASLARARLRNMRPKEIELVALSNPAIWITPGSTNPWPEPPVCDTSGCPQPSISAALTFANRIRRQRCE
jgi:molybdate/tungstate transport system substrate-binding protein